MHCEDCWKYKQPKNLNCGSIFDGWVFDRTYDWINFAMRADITKMVFVDKPTEDDDFRVYAEISVRFLLSNQDNSEKYERSFEAEVDYLDERKSYLVIYHVPYKKSVQGILMNTILGFKQQFGSAIAVAGGQFIEESGRFIKDFAKQYVIKPTFPDKTKPA